MLTKQNEGIEILVSDYTEFKIKALTKAPIIYQEDMTIK